MAVNLGFIDLNRYFFSVQTSKREQYNQTTEAEETV
jgi:hypothetical protein